MKVVVEREHLTESQLIIRLKNEINSFPKVVGWCTRVGSTPDWGVGIPSLAAQGNFLEAINVTLNVLEKHYMDRDLARSGNSIVMISAGTGVFEVCRKLAGIPSEWLIDAG
ncbi:unnamed protein product, partial [Discosporangium mesarthrocarpum]